MTTDERIAELFASRGLGTVTLPVTPVDGGLMHRMYRVDTVRRTYAVKHLNPEIMKRPEAMENYRRAERLEQKLEDAGIPVVAAIPAGGRKMQESGGEYFYIFPWQNGSITDWHHITGTQCRQAGNILGRIHALDPVKAAHTEPETSRIDWSRHIQEAERQKSTIASVLAEHEDLLNEAQEELNLARRNLPDIECITDGDMDPKNVMWNHGNPVVIDLECLDRGNPVPDVVQLSLQWAGITTCTLAPDRLKAFFNGYLEAYDNGFRDYGTVAGLAYTWIEWLEYNITRALDRGPDARERGTGETEVRNTVNRIRYIRENEDRIRQWLEQPLRD